MALHSELAGDLVHTPFRFIYPNEAARTSAQGLTSQSINKLALQSDDYSVWILKSVSPLVWESLGDKDLGTAAKRNIGTSIGNVPEIVDLGGGEVGIPQSLVGSGDVSISTKSWTVAGTYTFTMPTDKQGWVWLKMIGGGGSCGDSSVQNGASSSFGEVVALGGLSGSSSQISTGSQHYDYPSRTPSLYNIDGYLVLPSVTGRSIYYPGKGDGGEAWEESTVYVHHRSAGNSGTTVAGLLFVNPGKACKVVVGRGGSGSRSGQPGAVSIKYW